MRRNIPNSTWNELRTAYASGIGLRELARSMNIPAGTILARSKREGWTRQIQTAKALATQPETPAIAPMHAAALTMRERAQRHVERVAGIVEKTLPHIEGMEPGAILDRVDDIDRLDRLGRRSFGLDWNGGGDGQGIATAIQINIG